VMERKMLRGIKRRAEAYPPPAPRAVHSPGWRRRASGGGGTPRITPPCAPPAAPSWSRTATTIRGRPSRTRDHDPRQCRAARAEGDPWMCQGGCEPQL